MGSPFHGVSEKQVELKIGTCRILVDFGFPAMLALLFLCANAEMLRQTFAVCLLHEIGHGAAMAATGAGIREIRLYGAGVQLRTRTPFLSTPRELAVLLSGPAVNLAAAALLLAWRGGSVTAFLHLAMGLFNLLPYRVLDGGSAWACLLSGQPVLLRIQTAVCICLSAGLLILLIIFHVPNPFLYLISLYLAAAQLRVDKQDGM